MRHRGRTYLVGVASAAGVLAFAIAPAAGVAKSTSPSNANLIKCEASLTLQVPGGQDGVLPGQTPGKQLGAIHCSKGIGGGLEEFSYKVNQASGNEVGSFVAFFKNATIKGKFNLVPQEGSFGNGTTSTFGFSAFAGTVKQLSGTGVWASAKGTGTATCSAQDGLHFKCVEKL